MFALSGVWELGPSVGLRVVASIMLLCCAVPLRVLRQDKASCIRPFAMGISGSFSEKPLTAGIEVMGCTVTPLVFIS